MTSTTQQVDTAYALLFDEYAEAFVNGSRELVSTPACDTESTQPAELLWSTLDAQHKLGDSTMLHTILDVIAWAEDNGSEQALLLINELSGLLAAWQIKLLQERGAL